jgi:hypothetical protein
MNTITRALRFVPLEEQNIKPSRYWRTLTYEQRLLETIRLHKEGNKLFKGGNPPFVYVMEFRHVPPL